MIVSSRDLMPVVKDGLKRWQRVRLTVNGSSMMPFIHSGDLVELKPAEKLRLGDVALVQTGAGASEKYVLHRVVRISGGSFFLRGDYQVHCEGPFGPENLLGVVSTSWRRGHSRTFDRGWWRLAGWAWMKMNPLGFFILQILIPMWRLGRRLQKWLHSI